MTQRRDEGFQDFLTPPTSAQSGEWEGLDAYAHTDEMPVTLARDAYDQRWWHDKRARFEARERQRQLNIRHIAEARRAGIISDVGYDWLQIELSMDLLPDVFSADGGPNFRIWSEYDQRWYSPAVWETRASVLLGAYARAERASWQARQAALPVDHPDRVTLRVATIDLFSAEGPVTPTGPGGLPVIPEQLAEPWHRALIPPWSPANDGALAPTPQRRRTPLPAALPRGAHAQLEDAHDRNDYSDRNDQRER